jgi:hypothetical protein
MQNVFPGTAERAVFGVDEACDLGGALAFA